MDYISQPQLEILEEQVSVYRTLASLIPDKDSEEHQHLVTTGKLNGAIDELRLGGCLARNAITILERLSNPELESKDGQQYQELVRELHSVISASNSCYDTLAKMLDAE